MTNYTLTPQDVFGYGPYQTLILNDSPLFYWRMDDASGSLADATGNSRTGTSLEGTHTYSASTLLTAGSGGTAVTVGGRFGASTSITYSSTANTVEFWMRGPSSIGSGKMLGGWKYDNGREIYYNSGIIGWNSGVSDCYGATFNPWDGNVHHYVFVFKPGAAFSTGKMYIDGVQQTLGGTGASNSFNTPTSVAFVIAGWANDSSLNASGATYDEVAVYNYELTATQVSNHYAAGTVTGVLDSLGIDRALVQSDSAGVTDNNNRVNTTLINDSIGTTDSIIISRSIVVQDAFDGLAYDQIVLADSPQAYLKLDESSGTFADATGNGFTGTAQVTYTYSQPPLVNKGTSVRNTSNGGIQISTPTPSSTANTVEFWFKGSGSYSGDNLVAGWKYNLGGDLNYQATQGRVGFNAGGGEYYGPSFNLGDGNIHHVVAVFKPGQTFANGKIYIDGVLQSMGGAGSTTTFATPSSTHFAFGNWADNGTGNGTNGYYDSAALYNYELTATQVLNHYNAGISAGAISDRIVGSDMAQQDSVGPTDSISISITQVNSDSTGTTDSATIDKTMTLSSQDPAGVTDSTTQAIGRGLTVTDSANPSDSIATSGILTATLVDLPQVTDSFTTVKTSPQTFVGWGIPLV